MDESELKWIEWSYLPKSHNFKTAVSGLSNKFCGLISLWQMPVECM